MNDKNLDDKKLDDKNSHDKVLIVDFGSQVTQLIARRVREEKVYCEIVPYQKAEEAFRAMRPKAVILSGGPASVLDKDAPLAPKAIYDAGVPVLGICYGEQAMAQQLGGKVEGGHHREFGRAEVEVVADSPIFEGVWRKGEKYPVWMSHGDRVTKLPEGFRVLGISPNAPISIIGDDARKFYATQFHLEVMHTPHGAALLRNFVRKVAGCAGDWTMRAFKEEAIEKIRKQVGKGRVICGLSGGVDSAVAAVLIHEAIGEQLTCVFVDHGLLRLAEAQKVAAMFRDSYNIPLVHVNAEDTFLKALAGVEDPEAETQDHRPTVHRRVRRRGQEDRRRRLPRARHALPGRDRERVVHRRAVGHHQVAPQCRRPARTHEDEAGRAVARIVQGRGAGARPRARPARQLSSAAIRFPGPGLAIRIPGAITREKLDILRLADEIYIEEIRRTGQYDNIWQAFAVLLPVKTVGVMGDGRTYDYVVALRAVTSTDGMTADFYPFDMRFLGMVATRIINEVKGVNRVVYDVTSKPPGTIEWE